jgi:hypothetical protein
MKQYVKYDVPAIPNQIPVIEIPNIQLQKSVNLMDMVSKMEPVKTTQ